MSEYIVKKPTFDSLEFLIEQYENGAGILRLVAPVVGLDVTSKGLWTGDRFAEDLTQFYTDMMRSMFERGLELAELEQGATFKDVRSGEQVALQRAFVLDHIEPRGFAPDFHTQGNSFSYGAMVLVFRPAEQPETPLDFIPIKKYGGTFPSGTSVVGNWTGIDGRSFHVWREILIIGQSSNAPTPYAICDPLFQLLFQPRPAVSRYSFVCEEKTYWSKDIYESIYGFGAAHLLMNSRDEVIGVRIHYGGFPVTYDHMGRVVWDRRVDPWAPSLPTSCYENYMAQFEAWNWRTGEIHYWSPTDNYAANAAIIEQYGIFDDGLYNPPPLEIPQYFWRCRVGDRFLLHTRAWVFGESDPKPKIQIIKGTLPKKKIGPSMMPILAGAALLMAGIWMPMPWNDLEISEGKLELQEGNLEVQT